jgi:hypothetical protein
MNNTTALIATAIVATIGLSTVGPSLFAQTESTVLILTNKNAKVLFDGEEKGTAEANTPFKISSPGGEHYAQVQYDASGTKLDKGEIVVLEPGKQKIVRLLFEEQPISLSSTLVSELNFPIPGSLAVGVWMNDHPKQQYPYPVHYFAFEKGDEIHIDVSMTNKNGTNQIEIATYPDNVVKYTNNGFAELRDITVKVEERSIYSFTFATNHAFDRNCIVKLSRKPASAETSNFNTNVSRQKVHRPVIVVEPSSLWVNSGSNATFGGGKSRLLIPVSFPPGTVEWFYRFAASRNPADIEKVHKNFQLLGELAQLLLPGAGALTSKAISVGVDQLTMPPGADYCDIYLLDPNNAQGFVNKTDGWRPMSQGMRENLMSGNVKGDCCLQGQYYLGIKNPAALDGINVSVEVIAITDFEELVMAAK